MKYIFTGHWKSSAFVNSRFWKEWEKGQYTNGSTSWTDRETQIGKKNPTFITLIVTFEEGFYFKWTVT